MITFKNIITNNTFTLPQARAVEIINQSPELFKVLSEVDEAIFKVTKPSPTKDLSTDIYDLVVQKDTEKVMTKSKTVAKSKAKERVDKMTLTFLDIYNSTASQAWSMFDDEVGSKNEFENSLISSINKALSDLWCSTDFPFRRRTDEIIIMDGAVEYDLPAGNLVPRTFEGKEGFCVSLDGKYLDYIEKPENLSEKKGKPTSFYIDGQYIYFYPAPDKVYEVAIDYYTVAVGIDKKGNPIYALKEETDSIDIPEKLEEIFKNALITKTMLYSIASDSDENYSNYRKQYEKAYKLLLKYSCGRKPCRRVRF